MLKRSLLLPVLAAPLVAQMPPKTSTCVSAAMKATAPPIFGGGAAKTTDACSPLRNHAWAYLRQTSSVTVGQYLNQWFGIDVTLLDPAPHAAVVVPAQGAGEPTFNDAASTLIYQDDMEAYTTATAMGQPPLGTTKRIVPLPSPVLTSQPVDVDAVSVVAGRNGGKALRLSYPGGSQQQSANFVTVNTIDQPNLVTHYFTYWARIQVGGSLTSPLAVKWFEAWHRVATGSRVQWNTHDHLPWTGGNANRTYWQVYDVSETRQQGAQPVGPYFDQLAADGQWHRFTHAYRPNSSSTARDGIARMWIDGVKVIDVSAAAIGLRPSGGEKTWCELDDVAALRVADGIRYIRWGSTQTTSSPPWFFELDDVVWWVGQPSS